jgi:subtilisin family serine protease
MSRIQELVRSVASDGRVTQAEWQEVLRPALETLPKRATPEAHPVIDLWTSSELILERGARDGMARLLQTLGYPATPGASSAEVIAGNQGEPDPVFESISRAVGRTDSEVTVAVLDGGFQLLRHSAFESVHPLLEGKLWTNPGEIPANGLDDDGNDLVDDVHGWDFAEGDADSRGSGHGLHVSGIATRGTDRIDALQLRVFGPFQGTTFAKAVDYAAKNGARVINLSFLIHGEDRVGPVLEVMAQHPELLFIKSAGNDGALLGEGDFAPHRYLSTNVVPNMVVVGATLPDGSFAPQSNRGAPYVTLAANGVEFSSNDPVLYGERGGTSQATPNVANVAAKCLALAPALDVHALKWLLLATSDRGAGWDDDVLAGGPVNAERAMRLAGLHALVSSGEDLNAAADRLALEGPEREKLIALARELGAR